MCLTGDHLSVCRLGLAWSCAHNQSLILNQYTNLHSTFTSASAGPFGPQRSTLTARAFLATHQSLRIKNHSSANRVKSAPARPIRTRYTHNTPQVSVSLSHFVSFSIFFSIFSLPLPSSRRQRRQHSSRRGTLRRP